MTAAAGALNPSLFLLSRYFFLVIETLAPVSFEDAGTSVPALRRVAPKLRHGFLRLLIKPIELGSSQSTSTSSAYRSPVAVDLLFPTISGLPDMLYSFLVSS
jgi:hypothetical protein